MRRRVVAKLCMRTRRNSRHAKLIRITSESEVR